MGDTDKKPIVMTMPGLDNLLMMYYVVRDKVIKLLSFQQSNPFNIYFFKSDVKAEKDFGKRKDTRNLTFCYQMFM